MEERDKRLVSSYRLEHPLFFVGFPSSVCSFTVTISCLLKVFLV